MVSFYLFLFLLFYILSIISVEKNNKFQPIVLVIACLILTILIGFRNDWPDERVYIIAFERAPKLWNLSMNDTPFGYSEKGYLYLASLIKTIYDNSRFYLLVIGGISIFLLYKSLNRYCIYPLIGLCDYIGRFLLNRDFIQMRSSLAILLVIFVLDLVYKKSLWRYVIIVLLAYQFHNMALIGLPFYFIYKIKFNRTSIVIFIILAFIASQILAGTISENVELWSKDLQYEAYTKGEYVERALGLRNPMIYFQTIILLLFTFMENRLKNTISYYYLLRTAYLYSTLILIFFCNYTALSGRTSTMFATVEIFILPIIARAFPKHIRYFYYIFLGFVFLYFFNSKYNSVMLMLHGINV